MGQTLPFNQTNQLNINKLNYNKGRHILEKEKGMAVTKACPPQWGQLNSVPRLAWYQFL
jgi:hypothetical protein